MTTIPISSLEAEEELPSQDLLPITLSHGTQGLPNMGNSLLPSHLDRVYLLMPIQPLRKMLGIGVGKTEKLIQEMGLNPLLPDGFSTILEQGQRLTSLSELSKKELYGSTKMVQQTLLPLLGRGTLTMIQLLLRSSLLVLSFLKTSTLRVLEATVSHLQEHPALAEALLDPALEVQDQATHPEALPQVHLESEL
uniref:ORF8b n=1 Tax=Middle East respiratory syndrome-related coronavirus TaxID=1335626 RepID=A0A2R4KP95_MERS|nr:ORF8b [Middle East respiratory syndrome-related coronavirus]